MRSSSSAANASRTSHRLGGVQICLSRDCGGVSDAIRHVMRDGVVTKTVINGMTFDARRRTRFSRLCGRPDRVPGSDGRSHEAVTKKLSGPELPLRARPDLPRLEA